MSADPIDRERLIDNLAGRWGAVRVVDDTGSTNADLLAAAASGEALPGAVLIAGHQSAGRGRRGRTWTAPPWSSVATSVLLKPTRTLELWTWLPLIVGLSVVTGIARGAGLRAGLKWPNDVLIAERKVCGILGQQMGGPEPAVVVGFGLNTSLRAEQLPVPTAGSLSLASAEAGLGEPDPTAVLSATLIDLADRLDAWQSGPADAATERVRQDWTAVSATLGHEVRIDLGTAHFTGVAESIDSHGRLLVRGGGALRAFTSGDVVHLRRHR